MTLSRPIARPVRWWWMLLAMLAVGCAPDEQESGSEPSVEAPVGARARTGTVSVTDSLTGCEGDFTEASLNWELNGDWLTYTDRRVPAGVLDRLRELASTAPSADGPLPAELRITEEVLEEGRYRIIEAAAGSDDPWIELLDGTDEDVTLERVTAAARGKLIDPDEDTQYALLEITLPGEPQVVLRTASESPYAQPWVVRVGDAPERTVVCLEMSRWAALLVDPRGPAAPTLDGAGYWRNRFWNDHELWNQTFADEWADRHVRQRCAELEGWEEVSADWEIRTARVDATGPNYSSLDPELVAKRDRLLSQVRWGNRLDEYDDPTSPWSEFVDVHLRAEEAVAELRCLTKWKSAGPGRTLTLDAIGDRGHTESDTEYFHEPVWEHSKLAGRPDFEIDLRIDGKWVGTLLLGTLSGGAIVTNGHETLTGTGEARFHPTVGDYVILRPDGTTEVRKMPPIRR